DLAVTPQDFGPSAPYGRRAPTCGRNRVLLETKTERKKQTYGIWVQSQAQPPKPTGGRDESSYGAPVSGRVRDNQSHATQAQPQMCACTSGRTTCNLINAC